MTPLQQPIQKATGVCLASKRVHIALENADGPQLSRHDAELLLQFLSETLGVLSIDLSFYRDIEMLKGLAASWEKWTIEPSIHLFSEALDSSTLEELRLLNFSSVVIRPQTRPSANTLAELQKIGRLVHIQLDVSQSSPFLDTWIEQITASAPVVVELFFNTMAAVPKKLSKEKTSEIVRRLDEKKIEWFGTGLPFCFFREKERLFNIPQQPYNLLGYNPALQRFVDDVFNRKGVERTNFLKKVLRENSRSYSHYSQKALDSVFRQLGWSSKMTRRSHRFTRPLKIVAEPITRYISHERKDSFESLYTPNEPPPKGCIEECERCTIQRVCWGISSAEQRAIETIDLAALIDCQINDANHYVKNSTQLIPAVDVPRLPIAKPLLSQHALNTVQQLNSATPIASSTYKVKDTPFDKMNGSIQWMPLWYRFCESTVLTPAKRPFTISASFYGQAEYIGFSMGPNLQVMCPMTADRHRLIVHVDSDGNHVLLRDDKEVSPVCVPDKIHQAGRIPLQPEPRLAALGIGDKLITQEILYWSEAVNPQRTIEIEDEIDISVIVICTKFSRRLNQFVRSLMGQEKFELNRVQLIISYVPGLDGTEDILEALEMLCPSIHVTRVPFEEKYMNSKGFMINHAVSYAHGRRVILTDADIIFPPDLFFRLETEFAVDHFVGMDGRKMLDPETTAALCMGLFDPSKDFAYLRNDTPGELRIGEAKNTPIGYFQCVLKSHFEKVKYEELPHFEGADMRFALDIIRNFGKETTMKDTVVLHQDHAGSRWFGTQRQF